MNSTDNNRLTAHSAMYTYTKRFPYTKYLWPSLSTWERNEFKETSKEKMKLFSANYCHYIWFDIFISGGEHPERGKRRNFSWQEATNMKIIPPLWNTLRLGIKGGEKRAAGKELSPLKISGCLSPLRIFLSRPLSRLLVIKITSYLFIYFFNL